MEGKCERTPAAVVLRATPRADGVCAAAAASTYFAAIAFCSVVVITFLGHEPFLFATVAAIDFA